MKGTVVGSSESVSQRFPVECSSGLRLAKPVVMLGDVPKGKLRSVFLQGYNRSTEPMSPRVIGLPPYLEVAVSPEVVPPGEQFSFVFYMRSDKCPLYGFVADTVKVQATPDLGCDLTVTAIIKEDFSKLSEKDIKKSPIAHLATETIDFGTLQSDSETRTATVKNLGKSTLEIRRVYSADPGVSVEVDRMSIKPGKEATLTVKVNRVQLRGSLLNARIQLITNDPMAPVQNLRASGLIGE